VQTASFGVCVQVPPPQTSVVQLTPSSQSASASQPLGIVASGPASRRWIGPPSIGGTLPSSVRR
jgi:hypothetical protein